MRLDPAPLVGRHKGRTCVIMGNAPSMLDLQLGLLALRQRQERLFTMGCNRGIGVYLPNYYAVCDRRPYAEYRWLIEQIPSVLLLSDTLFEQNLEIDTPPQKPPNADWYWWRPTTKGELDTGKQIRAAMDGKTSVVEINPHNPIHSGANIAYCMLQLALILGFHRIGLVGIDLLPSFDPKKPSHVGGGNARKGCVPAPRKTLCFFAAAQAWIKRLKLPIEVKNLSPVRGPLDSIFGYTRDFVGWINA